jgi:hypothetical protein
MTLFEASNQSFNVASVLYAVAFFLYAGQLVSNKKLYNAGASWVARSAWAMHTLALVLRWMFAGLEHPPWTNLYESLVFFSWGVMTAHLYLELRFGFKLSGVFATALVFAAMGVASLHPHKEIEPLVPALQSWWLLFHVFMACIAYAFFLGASFIAVFFLLKDKVRVQTMAGVAALVCVLFLSIAVGKQFFLTSQVQFFKVAQIPGQAQDVIMNFKGPDGRPMQQFVNLPGAPYIVWPLLLLYLAASSALLSAWIAKLSKKTAGISVVKIERVGQILLCAAIAVQVALLIDIIQASRTVQGMHLKSNPYRLAAVILTLGIASFFASLFWMKDRLIERLPSKEVLDRWNY